MLTICCVMPLLDLPGRPGQWPLGFPLLDLPGVQVNGPWVSLRAHFWPQGGDEAKNSVLSD